MQNHSLLELIVHCTFGVVALAMTALFVYVQAVQQRLQQQFRSPLLIGTLVAGITAIGYGMMFFRFESALNSVPLHEAGTAPSPDYAFFDLLLTRFVIWFVVIPLLLVQISRLFSQSRHVRAITALLILCACWMLIAAFIGEYYSHMQIRHLIWGTVATIGYAGIVFLVFAQLRKRPEKLGYTLLSDSPVRNMSLPLITSWGVYPLGYIATSLFPNTTTLLVTHLAYNVADFVNIAAPSLILLSKENMTLQKPRMLPPAPLKIPQPEEA